MSDKPCGLQQTEYANWTLFNRHVSSLPDCTTGYEPGRDRYFDALHHSRSLTSTTANCDDICSLYNADITSLRFLSFTEVIN